jgi:hypothetical protein
MCKSGMSCNGCVQLAGMSEPTSFAWNLLIALMMEAVIKSETLVNFYKTIQPNIPEDSLFIFVNRENLKSQQLCFRNVIILFLTWQ